jgi:competence protein ComEC
MSKSRFFLLLLIAFVGGVGIRSFWFVPYTLLWLVVASSATAMALGAIRQKQKFIYLGFIALSLVLGIIKYDASESARPDLASLYGRPMSATGIVIEEPEESLSAQRLKIKVDNFHVLVTTRRFPAYALGDELEIAGLLTRPENFSEFDYAAFLAKDDVYAVMSFPQIKLIGSGKGSPFKEFLSRIKTAFEGKIDLALPEPHASFLKGLLLGERESFSKEFRENLSRTGTTHIVALSGYNITLVSRFFIWGLLLLTIPYRVSFWIAALAIILFVLLTGASPSVVRAGIMGVLILVAEREGRMYQIRNALVFAAAVMIFQNPKILRFDAAFQLSFLATLGLIYLSPVTESLLDRLKSKITGFRSEQSRKKEALEEKSKLFPLRQMLTETISAQLMVLPLIIYLFGRVSLVSPISNILVVAAVPYSMGIGFLVGLSGFVSENLAIVLGWFSWILLEYKFQIIYFFAKIPGASINLGKTAALILAIIYLGIFIKIYRAKISEKS